MFIPKHYIRFFSVVILTFSLSSPLNAARELHIPTLQSSTPMQGHNGACSGTMSVTLHFKNISNLTQTLTITKTNEFIQFSTCNPSGSLGAMWVHDVATCHNAREDRTSLSRTYNLTIPAGSTRSISTGIRCNIGDSTLNCTDAHDSFDYGATHATTISGGANISWYKVDHHVKINEDRGAVIGSRVYYGALGCIANDGTIQNIELNAGRPF